VDDRIDRRPLVTLRRRSGCNQSDSEETLDEDR
jgi:hypothetical protein